MRLPWGPRPLLIHGPDPLAARVLARLRADGRRVERIDETRLARLDPRQIEALILTDPPEAARLVEQILAQGAGIKRRARRRSARLILMHAAHPPPTLPEPPPDGPWRIETFALQDRAARALLARWPLHLGLDPGFGQIPHLLIVGFADPARAVLVQALRLIQYGMGTPRVTILCQDAPAIAQSILRDYPQAPEIATLALVELTDHARPLARRLSLDRHAQEAPTAGVDAGTPPVTLALVCLEDAVEGLDIARRLIVTLADLHGVSPPILLETGPRERVASRESARIEDWDGQIIPFDHLDIACSAAVLLDGRGDEVARAIHDQYRDSIAAQGRDPDREPAGQPWERLATSYRQANRHQADHVWAKLVVTDTQAVPEELVESFVLTPLEVERLAIIEHARWAADRYLDGWRYAPVRDNALKHHPQLIPYEALTEPMKDLDRFAVRGLPVLLARQGLGILRQLIVGIPPTDRPGPSGVRLQRLLDQALDRLLARYPDRRLVLAASPTDPVIRPLLCRALERAPEVGFFLLLPMPLSRVLAARPDADPRRELLTLVARAERRISLRGESELTRWLAQRAEIALILGAGVPEGSPRKRVQLDPSGQALDWTFEY